jgi:DNA-binding response OmpR family regulator
MPKVLIIEDSRETIVFIANKILKPKGYEIITARNGQIGLEKAEREFPDLIIIDLKLPQMSGLEVMEQLLQKGVCIPSIVVTFHGTETTAVQAFRLGARDYLIKPFTIEEMEAALERALKPQPTTPEAYRQKLATQAKVASMEKEIGQLRALLTGQEELVEKLQKEASNLVDKDDLAKLTERATAWEEDNARLSEMLAETKEMLNKAESRADALEEAMLAQKTQINKYQKETIRLASELRNLSQAIHLMSQDMAHHMNRLDVLSPRGKK